jgi:signal transduction histidine kinase
LNAIIGFSDMIRQQVLGPISPHRYADYVEDIHHSGTHLLSLINDVLDMAKIEAEKFELNRRPIDIAAVAEGSLLFVAHQAEKAGVSLKAEVRSGIMLMADERAIRQVLTNLLSNAVKFTPAGGSVRLFGEVLANGLFALGVEDTGIGMSEEGLVTALEPFGQVERDISVKSVGTGLGLPLAKEMIEMHGALFQITSKVGFGTRVWATFPACDVLKSAPATEAVG